MLVDGAGGAADERLREDVEGGVVVCVAGASEARGGEDGFEFTGADYGVYFGDVLLDFVAVALDEAAGDDDTLGLSAVLLLVLDHLEDGVDGLLLGGVDEAAGVDDDDLGVFGSGREFGTVVMEQAHHDLGVDEVFGAAERDEAYLGAGGCSGLVFDCFRRSHSLLVYQFYGLEALVRSSIRRSVRLRPVFGLHLFFTGNTNQEATSGIYFDDCRNVSTDTKVRVRIWES